MPNWARIVLRICFAAYALLTLFQVLMHDASVWGVICGIAAAIGFFFFGPVKEPGDDQRGFDK